MLLRCAVLLLYLMVTAEVQAGLAKDFVSSDIDERYSLWPSIHQGVRLMRLRKREAQPTTLNADAQASQSVQPNGQAVQLSGHAGQPIGQAGQLNGHAGQPIGQAGQLNGHAGQPIGQAGQPIGQAGQPIGQAGQPIGQAGQLNGHADQPNAQALQPNTQAAQEANVQSEGQSSVQKVPSAEASNPQPAQPTDKKPESAPTQAPASPNNKTKGDEKPENLDNKTVNKPATIDSTTSDNSTISNKTSEHNVNVTATEPPKINLSDPGVMKRAAIVFGGFALLAVAYYFIIYRKKGNNNDAKNSHSSIDQNQFRYGVLESEDKSSNMELSRVPLTMESDEDDDEDLEIFDLGQKKRSLSYINLEQHDEDIVLNDSRSVDMENLLVDIEDKNSDMINWSGNGSKSIL